MSGEPLNLDRLVAPGPASGPAAGRPWLGVHFVCANKYLRVYRDVGGERYTARCPSCGRCAVFRVGRGGTESRQFEVSCR